jgi:hypothetical protein
MFTKRLLVCLGLMALTTPAVCAQFFIVQDPKTDRCTVEERAPAPGDPNAVVVGDGAYGERALAEADMRTIAACAGKKQ